MATEVRQVRVLVDVTDLVEFLQRKESVSGVQRVIAETAPLILAADPRRPWSSSTGRAGCSSS